MSGKSGLQLLGLFAAVFAACLVSMLLFRGSSPVSVVWPANALVLAVMLRAFTSLMDRAQALLISVAAMILASLIVGRGILVSYGFAFANIVEIGVAAWLIGERLSPFNDGRALWRFLAGAVLAGPLASAMVAGLALLPGTGLDHAMRGAGRWLAADSLGMAIWAPFALTIGACRPLSMRGWLKAAAIMGLVIGCVATIFFAPNAPLFLVFPFLILSVYAHRELGPPLALAATGLIAAAATWTGHGPLIVALRFGWDPVLVMEIFLAAAVAALAPTTALLRRLDSYAADAERRAREATVQSEIKTRFLAHVSHEIRSPLSGVVTLAQMMEQGAAGALSAPQQEIVHQIAESGGEIEALSRDLLDAAALQSGKVKLNLQVLDLQEVIDRAVSATRFRLNRYDATLRVAEKAGAGLAVRADAQRIQQILLNLIGNAAKYGGSPPAIELKVRRIGGRLRIEVDDNGPGIPAAKRGKLFTPFDRLGAERTEVEGAGLGLALSRDLARLQGGDIGVGDGELGGACFWLDLPVSAMKAAA